MDNDGSMDRQDFESSIDGDSRYQTGDLVHGDQISVRPQMIDRGRV